MHDLRIGTSFTGLPGIDKKTRPDSLTVSLRRTLESKPEKGAERELQLHQPVDCASWKVMERERTFWRW